MKQRGLPPWDLAASVLIAAFALANSFFPSMMDALPLGYLISILAILLPGYLLSIVVFPRRYDLADNGRLAVIIGADILLILIQSIVLSVFSWGLSLSSLAASAAVISIILTAIAYFSRSALPRWSRFVPFVSGSRLGLASRKQAGGISRRLVALIVFLGAAAILVTFAYSAISPHTVVNVGDADNSGKEDDSGFTEFYILSQNDEANPAAVRAGTELITIAGIVNRERNSANYTLVASINGDILSQREIELEHNQSWEGAVDYVLNEPGNGQRVDFLLYKNGDLALPYAQDHIWLNVSMGSNHANESDYRTSGKKAPAVQNVTKIVVMGIDEAKSGDNRPKSKATSQVNNGIEKAADLEQERSNPEDKSKDSDNKISGSQEIPSPEAATQPSIKVDEEPADGGIPEISGEKPADSLASAIIPEIDALELDKPKKDSLSADNSPPADQKLDDSGQDNLKAEGTTQIDQESNPPTKEPSKATAPKAEVSQREASKLEASQLESTQADDSQEQAAQTQASQVQSEKLEVPKINLPKLEIPKIEPPKVRPPKVEAPKIRPPKVEAPVIKSKIAETTKSEAEEPEIGKSEAGKAGTGEIEAAKMENSPSNNLKTGGSISTPDRGNLAANSATDLATSSVTSTFTNPVKKTSALKEPSKDKSETQQKGQASSSSKNGEAAQNGNGNDKESMDVGSQVNKDKDNKNDLEADKSKTNSDADAVSAKGDSKDSNSAKNDNSVKDDKGAKDDKSVSEEDKDEAEESSEMDSEINSWVGSRSVGKSDQGQSFKSKNIQYVKKGGSSGSAVLGSQSKSPVKIG